MRGAGVAQQVSRGVDQRQMSKRLRKITQLPFCGWIVFLCKQADVIPQRQKPVEQFERVIVSVVQDIVVRQPEAASQEGALSRRETVGLLVCVISQHKSIANEIALNSCQCTAHTRVVRWQEAYHWDQQETGIERRDAKGLHERILFGIEAFVADLLVNRIANGTPMIEGPLQSILFNRSYCAVEGDPRHDFGVCKMLATTSHFPDAAIRLIPDCLQMGHAGTFKRPARVIR